VILSPPRQQNNPLDVVRFSSKQIYASTAKPSPALSALIEVTTGEGRFHRTYASALLEYGKILEMLFADTM